MPFKKGDMVQLKVPEQGRLFRGTVDKITGEEIQVNLPNGLYIIRPQSCWEFIKVKGNSENDQIRK